MSIFSALGATLSVLDADRFLRSFSTHLLPFHPPSMIMLGRKIVKVLGVLMHASALSSANLQWAQVWVSSEADVVRCLGLKGCLAPSGM